MRLSLINEDSQSKHLRDEFHRILPNHRSKNKLIDWALSRNIYSNPGELHTSELIRQELEDDIRLVGNPWKDNVKKEDLVDLYILDHNKQLMVSLPDNKDVVDFVVNAKNPENHIVRGLAFGYDPKSVYDYYKTKSGSPNWIELVEKLGVISMTNYGGGFKPVLRDNIGLVYVYPQDIKTLDPLIDRFELIKVSRYCPKCNAYVVLKGENAPFYKDHPKYEEYRDLWPNECNHKPVYDRSDKNWKNQHFFSFSFRVE